MFCFLSPFLVVCPLFRFNFFTLQSGNNCFFVICANNMKNVSSNEIRISIFESKVKTILKA